MQLDPVSRATSKWPMQLSIKRVECKIDCELRIIVLPFSHLACFLINIFGKLPFSGKSDSKKEKSVLSFTHEQNNICSQTQLDDIAPEQTIICRQLFAGHVVGSQPKKRKKNLHRMIVENISSYFIDTHFSQNLLPFRRYCRIFYLENLITYMC